MVDMLLIKGLHDYVDGFNNKIIVGNGVKANKMFSMDFIESRIICFYR